jgi:Protein of unknown function (DUF1569)
MKTLGNQIDRTALLDRLQQLQPDSQRRWGKMSAHQMVCHLHDSFEAAIGEKQVSSISNLLSRTLVRWIALRVPLRWPHGLPTRPEMDQLQGGTPPQEFTHDVLSLAAIIQRVSSPNRDFQWDRHPAFGEMSDRDWLRWGYLHTDHHLRQFGL